MARKRRVPRYIREAELPPEPQPGERDRQHRIVADLSKQQIGNSYGGGRLYCEDLPLTCVDCGAEQVWTAEQQQWWYEVAQGHIASRAIRCRACRQVRRNPGRAE